MSRFVHYFFRSFFFIGWSMGRTLGKRFAFCCAIDRNLDRNPDMKLFRTDYYSLLLWKIKAKEFSGGSLLILNKKESKNYLSIEKYVTVYYSWYIFRWNIFGIFFNLMKIFCFEWYQEPKYRIFVSFVNIHWLIER